MQAYYLDTSALVKRYAREEGTAWMTTLTDPAQAHDLYDEDLLQAAADEGLCTENPNRYG